MKNIIAITSLLAAGTMFASADVTKTFDTTRCASVVILFDVEKLRSISDTEFAGGSEAVDFLKFTGTWWDSSGSLGLANNGSSTADTTGLWGSWVKGSSSGKGTDIGLGSVFTSATTWNTISAISAACSFSTPESDAAATVMNVALAIKYSDGTQTSVFSASSSKFNFSGKSGFSATGFELNDAYTSLYSFDATSAFASADAAAAAATAAIPEPSAFGLLAGVGALAFVAARRRRRAK